MQSRRFGPESERVLELKLVLADILARPFTGIGAWGRYTGYQQISWQANPDGGLFLHSGVLHVALKCGLPGMALFAGTVWAFVLVARRALRDCRPNCWAWRRPASPACRLHDARHPDRHAISPGAHDADAGRGLALPYVALAAGNAALRGAARRRRAARTLARRRP